MTRIAASLSIERKKKLLLHEQEENIQRLQNSNKRKKYRGVNQAQRKGLSCADVDRNKQEYFTVSNVLRDPTKPEKQKRELNLKQKAKIKTRFRLEL
jgi:hypothetical protein